MEKIKWYSNFKFLTGVTLVLISFFLGFYGKVLFISRFYEPVALITGLSIYAISWIILFFGAFLIGWESVKMIQRRIHHHVKRTYHYTKQIPKRSFNYTRRFGNRFREKNKNKIKPKEAVK